MSQFSETMAGYHPQQTILAKCFHPSGSFIEFKKEDVEQSIPDRFEQMVATYPDRLAVKSTNHALTYDDLNRMANRVAQAVLAQCGEGNEPVVLLLENNTLMIAVILGVLKAGKTYVPLDPIYPRERLAFMLEDSQTHLIVTNNKNLSLANGIAWPEVQLIDVDALESSLSTENIGLSISADALAWILYTSGSTGQPKGVVQNHRNVLHDIMQFTNTLHISPEDRVTLLFSCSVNAGAHDIFSSLLNGASLYPLDIKQEGLGNLTDWLIQEEITFFHAIPTVFRNSMHMSRNKKFPKVRLIRFGGERVLAQDVQLYKEYFSPDCILQTGLGTTETGFFRQYFMDKKTELTGRIVPVGYPVQDMKLLLLDGNDKGIGFNEVGEIVVKSRYVSPGYWRRPDLTQTVFLPDPDGGNERIYLTGDLGRMLPDGCLFHLERKDFQVKIRGQRIEVAEIEMVLLSLKAVKESVVVARDDQSGDTRLVAYVVPTAKPGLTVSGLRQALAEKLPDYMIPSAFVTLDALPLTPNGKVDRRALPDPGRSRPELDIPFVAPRTPGEERLAQIWAEVLSLDQVGIHDKFLDLGGDSLLATQVISRVRKAFSVELPLRSLFEMPTVSGLANVIQKSKGSGAGSPAAKISPVSRQLQRVKLP